MIGLRCFGLGRGPQCLTRIFVPQLCLVCRTRALSRLAEVWGWDPGSEGLMGGVQAARLSWGLKAWPLGGEDARWLTMGGTLTGFVSPHPSPLTSHFAP
jgi:hypothetical protein